MSSPAPTDTQAAAAFVLQPPEVIQPVNAQVAKTAVPISDKLKSEVDSQVERFVDGLLTQDLESVSSGDTGSTHRKCFGFVAGGYFKHARTFAPPQPTRLGN